MGDVAECSLVVDHPEHAQDFGIGEGCCMAATAVRQDTGKLVNWASLPPEWKRAIAQQVLAGTSRILLRRGENAV
jgi:hypothetical protein